MHNKALAREFGPLFIIVGITAISSVGVYFGSDYLFALENIEVAGDGLGVAVNEEKIPNNLLFFPAEKVKEEILRDNPILGSLELKKKFPHTLIIVAMRREPIAKITLESIDGLIDREGYIVGIDDGTHSLPLITLEPLRVSVGQQIREESVRAALALIVALPPHYVMRKITRYDRRSIVGETEVLNIIVPQNIDASTISTTLQTILGSFKIKGTMPTRIDLRFDKPFIQL